jgi:hypothetical protein
VSNLDRAGLILGSAAVILLRLAWWLCPLPDLIRRGGQAIDAADLGGSDDQ